MRSVEFYLGMATAHQHEAAREQDRYEGHRDRLTGADGLGLPERAPVLRDWDTGRARAAARRRRYHHEMADLFLDQATTIEARATSWGQTGQVDVSDEDEQLAALGPVERQAKAAELITEHEQRIKALKAVRSAAVAEVMAEHGGTKAARVLGLSRDRVYQIVRS